jgi:hypothetical protein
VDGCRVVLAELLHLRVLSLKAEVVLVEDPGELDGAATELVPDGVSPDGILDNPARAVGLEVGLDAQRRACRRS